MEDRIGQQLGNYRLTLLIGRGAFAEVFLGEHVHDMTWAAVKVLYTRLTSDGLKDFINEARSFRLKHPSILQLLDFGISTDDTPFLVIDYAPNGTLRQRHIRGSRIPLATVITYVTPIASALQYAHDQRIIHRDVKPENMLLGPNDEVLLSDFGIATMAHGTASQSVDRMTGTSAYMAPEQIMGKPRPASDQYALGIVVYEWLCGNRPFNGTATEIALQHLSVPPSPLREKVPEISPAVEGVVLKALAKDPKDRFASVQDFADALEQAYKLEEYDQPNFNTLPSLLSVLPQPSVPSISSAPTQELLPKEISPTLLPGEPVPGPAEATPDRTISAIYDASIPINLTSPGKYIPTVIPEENKCPHCGSEIRLGDNFCLNCGEGLYPAVPSLQPPTAVSDEEDFIPTITSANRNKCPYCGRDIRANDVFCPKCSNRLIQSPSDFVQQQSPLTIGTRFMPTIEDQFGTAAELPAPAEEQASVADPWALPADQTSVSSSPPPPDATFALDQTIAQLLEEGEALYKARHYEDALATYERVVQLDPRNAIAYGHKGNVLGQLGRYKDAIAAYIAALAIDAKHASLWNAKGDVLSKLRRYDEALTAYEAALVLDAKNGSTWTAKCNAFVKLRRYDEALTACNEALSINSANARVWTIKGNVLTRQRSYEDALVAYDAALAVNSKDGLVWTAKASVLAKLGRYEDALVAYTCASNIISKKASIWAAKGEVLSQLRRYDEALEAYERAHHLSPNDIAFVHKCTMLRDLKRLAEVEERKKEKQAQTEKKRADTEAADQKTRVFTSDNVAGDQAGTQQKSQGAPKHQETEEPPKQGPAAGTRTSVHFDVFLSYLQADANWVKNLAMRLEDEHHLRVWLDTWMLVAGQPRQQEIARGLDEAGCCAVCIGEQTPIGWFKREIERALERQVKIPLFGVIPVLLPNAKSENIDAFLELNTGVDFRNLDFEQAFYLLVCGIKRIRPGRWQRHTEETFTAQTSINAKIKLMELLQMQQEKLIDPTIALEFQRIVLKQLWLPVDDSKGSTHE